MRGKVFSISMLVLIAFSILSFEVNAVNNYSKGSDGKYTVTYGKEATQIVEGGGLYYLFVVKGEYIQYSDTETYEYSYMDQMIANSTEITFSFKLSEDTDHTIFISSNKLEKPVLLGYIKQDLPEEDKKIVVDIGKDLILKYKATHKLNPSIQTQGIEDYTVKYSSSNSSVVSVDEQGVLSVTARPRLFKYLFKRASYTVDITCTVADNTGGIVVTDTCKLSATYTFWQLLLPFLF